ncbi:MAG: hypothetical protein K8S56_10810 [Candidatus Cloacimonetes bacterium]|nr:hypothetical protein [Candidatus Cloacimonadota bacterium]
MNNKIETAGWHINFDSLLKQGIVVIDARYRTYEISASTMKYVVTFIENNRETFYVDLLKQMIGEDIKQKDVYDLWTRMLQHKLEMSESLNRDVSIKVAAMDYYETVGL